MNAITAAIARQGVGVNNAHHTGHESVIGVRTDNSKLACYTSNVVKRSSGKRRKGCACLNSTKNGKCFAGSLVVA
jgi:hypothetical protein